MANLHKIRREYIKNKLDEKLIDADPFKQFGIWMENALDSDETEATAMVLSTVSKDLKPSSRIVLLKQYNQSGFDFYTNYNSKKGKQIEENNLASLLFFWSSLERQVRIEGSIVKLTDDESDSYFSNRPRESQIAACISPQSEIIANRSTLESKYKEYEENHLDKELKRPNYWGGYRLIPDLFEYWQGRENRLHDRIEYVKINGKWKIFRKAP